MSAKHARFVDQRLHAVRLSIVGLVWLAGLAAGFVAILAAVARYGCSTTDDGLACKTSGSVLGWLAVVAVIATVTAVTLMTLTRPARGVLMIGGFGLAALAFCFVAARSLLATA